jgi:colanic acid/amylovoran biosynthesis glycosyltransferase
VLTAARLVEKKGIAYAIRAVAEAVRAGRRLNYSIAGDGRMRAELERLIHEFGMERHVRLLGWKSRAEVLSLMRDAHILLAPSVTATDGDEEGIPNVVKEAMAVGLPVISTFHAGIPELVDDGGSGLLVPERDVTGLAERLGYLCDHPERWPEMGRVGRRRIERDFDITRLNDRLERLYAGSDEE